MNAFIQKLLQAAKDVGFTNAEVYVTEDESFEAAAMEQEITQYSVNTTRGLGFRAMLNGKMGYASTEALDDDAIEQLIKGALDSARLCEDTSEVFLHDGKDAMPEIALFHPALEEVAPQQKLDFVLALEREAKEYDPRIERVGDSTVFSTKYTVRIVNSFGMDRQYTKNLCGAYLQPIAREGESTATGVEIAVVQDFANLCPNALATSASQMAIDRLNAKSAPSGSYPILFENRAMASLLGVFVGIFSADNAQKGLSLLKGKIGEQVAAPCVTMVDNPLMENGFSSRPFDAEGVASAQHVVVQDGIFKTFLHNLKTAHKDGVQSTGNAGKAGYAGSVHVAPTNFYFEPGEKSLSEMMEAIKSGILITELSGLHSGANAVSGDFSLLAKGFMITGGQRAGAVEQITIAGNFLELFKSIRAVGSDLYFPSGGIGSPCIDAGELSVAGA